MTPEEKKEVRLEIEKQIGAAKRSIASLREQTKPIAPDRAIGRITRMDAIQQKSVKEANLRAAEETLQKLEDALIKLEDPGFGVCVKCKKTIPLGRILAIPEAKLCVPCASNR